MTLAIVGREQELAVLDRFLESVPAGLSAVVIEGEPGIGKTRLWEESLVRAEGFGYRVLACRPVEAEAMLSFSALSDLLEDVVDKAMPILPEPQRQAVGRTLLRNDVRGVRLDWRAVSVATISVVRLAADQGPLVLAVDDQQWLDPASARVLRYTLRRLGDEPVGVIVTSRIQGLEDSDDIVRDVSKERVARLEPRPLTLESLGRMISSRLGALPRPILVQVHRASGGNPYFALELARVAMKDRARLERGEPLRVPPSLRELLADRVEELPRAARRAVLITSALARPTITLVEDVGGSAARTGLQQALDRQVIEIQGEVVRFSHPLIRSIAYWEAPVERRRRLHRRLADAVRDPEEGARHLALATAMPDADVAAAVEDAARAAAARGATDAAAELFERAATLTPARARSDSCRRAVAAAESHFQSGDAERAAELLQGVTGSAPNGLMRAEALHRLGVVRHRMGNDAAATSLFERALDEAGDDPSVRSAIERRLAFSVVVGGDIQRGAAHISAALDVAEAWGDNGDVAESLGFAVMIDFLSGKGFAEDRMERAIALEDPARHVPIEWRPRGINAYILVTTGHLDRARSALETLRTEALDMGDESSLPYICHLLALTEVSSGEWLRADRHVEEGLAAATQTGQPLTEAFLRCSEALLDAYRGRVDRARETAERGLALAEHKRWAPIIQYLTSVLGLLDLSLGDAAATHRRLGPLGDFLAAVGLGEPGHLGFLPDEIEALVALGEVDRAVILLDMFEERARVLDRTWALATGARCRGLLEAARGELPSALAALDRALEYHRRLPYPFELGRTLLAEGMVRRRAKQKAAAREPLERALEVFERLGAPLWSKKAQDELDRIGGRARGPSGLTPTEQKVADLVSAGRTNAEVASALFLSVGTVEAYLSRVYRKLSVRSRSELVLLLSGASSGEDEGKP